MIPNLAISSSETPVHACVLWANYLGFHFTFTSMFDRLKNGPTPPGGRFFCCLSFIFYLCVSFSFVCCCCCCCLFVFLFAFLLLLFILFWLFAFVFVLIFNEEEKKILLTHTMQSSLSDHRIINPNTTYFWFPGPVESVWQSASSSFDNFSNSIGETFELMTPILNVTLDPGPWILVAWDTKFILALRIPVLYCRNHTIQGDFLRPGVFVQKPPASLISRFLVFLVFVQYVAPPALGNTSKFVLVPRVGKHFFNFLRVFSASAPAPEPAVQYQRFF